MCGIQAGFDGKSLLPLNFRSLSGARPSPAPSLPLPPLPLLCSTAPPAHSARSSPPMALGAQIANASPKRPASVLFHPRLFAAHLSPDHRITSPSLAPPPSHWLPHLAGTGACLHFGPFRADAEECPAEPPLWSSDLQQLPSEPPPSTLCGPATPQASCSPPPTSSPCSWSDYISLQCNPITNCPVSLEVMPPEGTISLPAELLLKSGINHTRVECSPTQGSFQPHHFFDGQH